MAEPQAPPGGKGPTRAQPQSPDAGASLLQRIAAASPLRWFRKETPQALVERGNRLVDRHSFGSAQLCFHNALALDPGCLPALRGLGTALMLQGGRSQLQAAEACLREVTLREPEDFPVYVALAGIYDKLGRAQDADRERRKLGLLMKLQQQPDNAAANNNLGILLVQQSLLEPARGRFQQAIAIQANLDVAHVNLAATCYRLANSEARPDVKAERIAEGVAAVERAMAIKTTPNTLITLALLKSLGGDTQTALDALAQAQAAQPDNKDVYAVMRTILERMGLFDEALKANEIYTELAED
jgi:tetratricopeptide (TPR) repeat protein